MSGGKKSVYDESSVHAFFKSFTVPVLRPAFVYCVVSIFFNFFFRQYRAALQPRVRVSKVDHPLDKKIPFTPSWIAIYLDFVHFWLRMLSFILRRYGRSIFGKAREFIVSMGRLYAYAAGVYKKNFSTTNRPFYIARPRFLLIHLVDPHLMCIPSLHVMVMIHTYTWFRACIRSLGEETELAAQIEEVRQGALAITQAILFVKQHSVNCIAAALYAMTCFDSVLFPPEEAEAFMARLFGPPPVSDGSGSLRHCEVRPCAAPRTVLDPADIAEIKAHILNLYRRFLSQNGAHKDAGWEKPLLDFLREQPCA